MFFWIRFVLFCWWFIICVHQWCWRINFVCNIFVWCWYQGYAGLIMWVWKHSFLCNFLEYFENDRFSLNVWYCFASQRKKSKCYPLWKPVRVNFESYGQIVWVGKRHRGTPGNRAYHLMWGVKMMLRAWLRWQLAGLPVKGRSGGEGVVIRHLKGCLSQSRSSVQMSRLNVTCEGIQPRMGCLNLSLLFV